MDLRDQLSHPKHNAQRNLCGRTHYVDDGTLRFHKSRVMSARVHDQGLLFSIVTSDALDYQNTKRGFRFVIFDLFGHVIARTDLDGAFRTSDQASKAMYRALDTIDAKAVTVKAIDKAIADHAAEMRDLRARVEAVFRAMPEAV